MTPQDPLAGGTKLSDLKRIEKLRAKIKARSAELGVQPRHTKEGHFYYVPEIDKVVGSVTFEHRNIKDTSIRNFEKNEVLRFVKSNYKSFTDENINSYLQQAFEAPILVRDNAGTKGDHIHRCRQEYFQAWIDSGIKPTGSVEEIAKSKTDIPQEFYYEVISGCAAVDKFITETGYIPLGVEIPVYDAKDEVAGTLDELGLMPFNNNLELVLGDTKSSNQLKDVYTLQIMRYCQMFVKLYRMRPKRIFIIKAGKQERDYKLEWFTSEQIYHGKQANKYLHKFNFHWEAIQEERKVKPIII